MSSDPRRPNARETARLKRIVFPRDDNTCQLRLPGCTDRDNLELHHITPIARTQPGDNPNREGNLTAACRNCNRRFGTGWHDPNSAHMDLTQPHRPPTA